MFSMLSMSVVHSILLLLTLVVLSVLVAPMWLLFSMVLLVASSVTLILLAGIKTEVMIINTGLSNPMVLVLPTLLLLPLSTLPMVLVSPWLNQVLLLPLTILVPVLPIQLPMVYRKLLPTSLVLVALLLKTLPLVHLLSLLTLVRVLPRLYTLLPAVMLEWELQIQPHHFI